MVKLELYDPTGVQKKASPPAPRLSTLDKKRIGFVSNISWQADRVLSVVKTWLEKDFPNTELLPLETFPRGSAQIDRDETAEMIKQSGVDLVIVGNAA